RLVEQLLLPLRLGRHGGLADEIERTLELPGRELLQLGVDRPRRTERLGEGGREQAVGALDSGGGDVLAAGGCADVAGARVAVVAVRVRLTDRRQGGGGGRRRRRRGAGRGRGVQRGAGRGRRGGRGGGGSGRRGGGRRRGRGAGGGRRRCRRRGRRRIRIAGDEALRDERVDLDEVAVDAVEADDEGVVGRLVEHHLG